MPAQPLEPPAGTGYPTNPATGLLNYFLSAINCGALMEDQALSLSGLTL
jgi:hypothetical protein